MRVYIPLYQIKGEEKITRICDNHNCNKYLAGGYAYWHSKDPKHAWNEGMNFKTMFTVCMACHNKLISGVLKIADGEIIANI